MLFLDEPTTGLDPTSRVRMWDVIRELVADGATCLLTTQYLDEADELADRIVVIDHGRVDRRGHVARAQGGRPAAPDSDVTFAAPSRRSRSPRSRRSSTASIHVSDDGRRLRAAGAQRAGSRRPTSCVRSTVPASWSTTSRSCQPSLDDVFFALTGRPDRERGPTSTKPTNREEALA